MAQPYSLNAEPVRWSVLAPVIAALVFVIPIPAWIIEDFFSRDMYPWLQDLVTSVTNVLPVAVIDVILIGTLLAVLHRTRRLYFVMRQRGVMDALWEAFRRIVRAAAILAVLFFWAWGFNYRRIPLDQALPSGAPPRLTVDALESGFSAANGLASRLRPIVQQDPGDFHTLRIELREPMNKALASLGRVQLTTPSQAKFSLVLSPYFRWAGITGMLNPLGLETIVLPDLLPFERPFVLAHEWGHLSGHADEAEASAVGWLACMKAGPAPAYSASLFLLMETADAMPADRRDKAMARVDAGVRSDLDAIAQRMQQQKPVVQRTASRVYDEYLRANRVADGTASYARALTLILAPPFVDALSGYTISR